jgi:hypothetical protein
VFPIFDDDERIPQDGQQPFFESPPLTSSCFGDVNSLEHFSSSRDEIYELIHSLPRDLHRDKHEKKEKAARVENEIVGNNQLLDVVEEDGDNDDDDNSEGEIISTGEEKLDIAWQYR